MAEQTYPDGEFAKQVITTTSFLLAREKRADGETEAHSTEAYLKMAARVSNAFRGYAD